MPDLPDNLNCFRNPPDPPPRPPDKLEPTYIIKIMFGDVTCRIVTNGCEEDIIGLLKEMEPGNLMTIVIEE